jgi:hypothetical protein
MSALRWLKAHNHLYKDVIIELTRLAHLEPETILPVHIQHIANSDGNESTVADHIPTLYPSQPDPASNPDLTEILRPPPSHTTFDSVVVADLDPHASPAILKSAALDHLCKPGSNFVEIPHDPFPVNEFNNPDLFPMMYPTLFPYGIGGPENKARRTPLSFKNHIKHFFTLNDQRFQEHYSFLFTAFNMLQRRALLLRTSLEVKRNNFDRIAAQFGTVSSAVVHTVAERVAKGDSVTANNAEERRVPALMKEVNIITSHVPGSAQSKFLRRNEIRALMMEMGMPSFYNTINPADIYHPMVKFLAGSEIDLQNLRPQDIADTYVQARAIAKNPSLTARFLNRYMKAVISTLLGYDPKQENTEGGVLGVCEAYYGCVEAQGRGSLHCHMMVWIASALNPDQMKARALANGGDADFQRRLIAYRDDVISNHVPGL